MRVLKWIGSAILFFLLLPLLPLVLAVWISKRLYKQTGSFKVPSLILIIALILNIPFVGLFGSTSPTLTPAVQLSIPPAFPTALATSDFDQKSDGLTLVTTVIDGDTFEIESGERVRMIGIDTPESVDPNRPIGCYGKEASQFTKSLLEGKRVRLEKDVSDTDRYGRLLRYVWLSDTLFNEVLVKEGYANSSTHPPDVKYQKLFSEAESTARDGKAGLWGEVCVVTSSKSITQSPTFVSVKQEVKTSCKYDCSGPDRDCSDFTSHLEAQQFFSCCGFSAGNDPMRLDKATGTGNGLACESLP